MKKYSGSRTINEYKIVLKNVSLVFRSAKKKLVFICKKQLRKLLVFEVYN